jgi:hypothetical protein
MTPAAAFHFSPFPAARGDSVIPAHSLPRTRSGPEIQAIEWRRRIRGCKKTKADRRKGFLPRVPLRFHLQDAAAGLPRYSAVTTQSLSTTRVNHHNAKLGGDIHTCKGNSYDGRDDL